MDKKESKQKSDKKPHAKKPEKPAEEKKDFRQLVRVSGVVLDGNKEVHRVIPLISGIGQNTAKSLLHVMGVGKDVKLGDLNEEEITLLEENISDIDKKIPKWMLNRRKDYDTGEDKHLTGSELEITKREDITRHKKIKSYRGVRHILGLPVRGQRTRTSFRSGSAIGVSRKKAAAAKAPAAAKGDKK
ncbi:MAG: 30S ribosomal protein S13 [Candidatus Altiarchaeota archaeon]|nr:30S ribosomal protein S13 [Candidatus Altiarchaeota archaeon]